MLKRTLIGSTLLGVILGAWSFDSSNGGQPAWALASLGVILALGALFELLTMFPDEGAATAGLDLQPSPSGRTGLIMVIGFLWVATVAFSGLPGGENGPLGGLSDHLRQPASWLLFASLLIVPLMLGLLRRGPGKAVVSLARQPAFALPYTCGLAALVFVLLQGRVQFAVGLVLVAKSSDIGAYFVGKTLGKHKMAPSISPNKTIEGMIGGLLLPALLA
ncbi:MAG: CDP-diglyceride synthetase, partial [Pseudohongiellaceae bacterium]